MASYTDAIAQFNPYVQQLPVDLMMKVGMQKQAQYDQGVQKIQSYIDNVAGLETSRPQDKEYLESKLNELGGKLRTVAAGDFSNQQLVNSVGGMASQIIKDPYIQSAVYSSAQIKKNNEIMEQAQKEGKLAPENVLEYNKSLEQYMKGGLGDRFNGQYIPYRNVFKKLKELGDAVGIDGTKIEQMWETDENGNKIPEYFKDDKGNFVLDKNGEKTFKSYKWNPIAVTETLKGKDAQKILAMFEAGLEPGDYQQLAMTGKWMYRNNTPENLAYTSEHIYDERLSELDAQIEKQKIYLNIAENAVNPNQEDIQKHAVFYNSLNKQRDSLAESAKKAAKLALSDPEQARATLYTNKYLSDISLRMASQDREIDYDVSALFTVFDKNRTYDMQIAENQASNFWKAKNYNLAVGSALRDAEKLEKEWIELRLKYGVGKDGKPIGLPGAAGLPDEIDLNKEGASEELVSQVGKSYSNSVALSDSLAYQLTYKFYRGIDKTSTDEQIRQKIERILKDEKNPMIPGQANSTLNRIAGHVVAKYNKDKNSLPAQTIALTEKYIKALEQTTYARAEMQDIDDKAYKIAKEEGIDIAGIQDVEKSIKPLKVDIYPPNEGKKTIILDKADVKNLAKIAIVSKSFTNTEGEKVESSIAQKAIIDKYGEKTAGAIFKSVLSKAELVTSKFVPFVGGNQITQLADKYLELGNSKITKIKAKLYKESGYITQGTRIPLYTDESNKAVVGDKLATVFNKYKSVLPEEDAEALVKGVVDGKFKANLDTRGIGLGEGTANYLEVNGKVIPISAQDYTFLSNMAPPENRGVPAFVKYTDSKGVSNITGKENPTVGNLFKDADFKNYKSNRYTLTGDFIRDDDPSSNLYWLKIYKHDKLGKEPVKPISYPYPISKIDDQGAINSQLRSVSLGINNNVLQQIEK